ncbi:phosphoribosylanthranilate isomerase [Aneurinibacillus sp. Ricciae_BoGa-3]|uniref:phosphoribosylanthranilate isomerase n=1 Tax=Aneurinibacillus sp. Ricciae_BoGa-3 TaxID=3022697 RepID=UPI002342021D|nr:phosphoribosylanthranilate isomerase [Aneurinibacillus sp. Ricciae_BoGa-3]WCK56087.1 phosphoribosylanthranilate isomerase [Aneurinibacillus sp. Ricciae_BoGa-3]
MSMHQPLIKICGLTDARTIDRIIERQLEVDWFGFVFAPSKRQMPIAEWKIISKAVPAGKQKKAGVFVNPTRNELDEVFSAGELDIVQLHGTETAAFCKTVKHRYSCKVMKVFGIPVGGQDTEAFELDPYEGVVDYVLLDTITKKQAGGTGKAFDWDNIPPYLAWCRARNVPLLVAGGINESNVAELLQKFGPDGVDISSGVETEGVKDLQKIAGFIERVRGR